MQAVQRPIEHTWRAGGAMLNARANCAEPCKPHVRAVQSHVKRTCRAMLNARAEHSEPWFSVTKTLVCSILVLAHD